MDRFVTIYDWMLELGLTGMETSAFAVIYSFGKDGGWYQGSASDLGKWMLTKRKHTVLDALAKLVDKGFIEKREKWENGKKLCDYRPVRSMVRKTHRTGADSAPHIYRDIDSDNNKEIKKERTVQLSLDEFKRRHR